MSPARILARSLMECATRDEWKRTIDHSTGFGVTYEYRNDTRDLTVVRGYAYRVYGGGGAFIATPFTLTKAEEEIVKFALDEFDRRLRSEKEAAALHRLTAQGIEAGTGETPKSGSTAKPRKPGRKAMRPEGASS